METNKYIYVDKGELEAFLESPKDVVAGYGYEWKNEGVVHLHTSPLPHPFGEKVEVCFAKGKAIDNISDIYSIGVEKVDGKLKVEAIYLLANCEKIPVEVSFIPSRTELYSRSKGILETSVLAKKRALIGGLGSFGSQIAVELAKAGVEYYSIFDNDRLELHNLSRHNASVNDLGRLKTDIIEQAIKGKNPYAQVEKYPVNINENLSLIEEEVEKADIVICATDNNESRFNLSTILVKKQKIGIFGRAVTRAEGGDVFIYRPGGPCYCCLIGNQWFDHAHEEITNKASARRNGQIAAYTSESDADAMVQVGLSSDIEPICNMMVKLSLMELSRGTDSGISCLEDELVYNYYIWANRRERRHKNWAPMPSGGNHPTIMRWYGAHIKKNDNCSLCSNSDAILDEGQQLLGSYGIEINNNDLSDITIEE